MPKGAGSLANSEINRQCRFVQLWFVKGKSAAQIVDEHGLDDGMSKPGGKTRQGDRLARIEVVAEFGGADISSLYADANSAARNGLCKSWV